jgi:transposase
MQVADVIKKMSSSDWGTLVENQKKRINELEHTIKQLEFKNIVLQEKYDLLVYKRFVRASETQDKTQPALFNEAAEETGTGKEAEAEKETIIYQRNKRKAGRKPLPENLTREERMNDLPEEEKTCSCGAALERIGEDINEKLIIEEPRIYVKRTVTPTYVCPCCKGGKHDDDAPCVIQQAPAVPAILPGSIASPSMLAHVFTAKFADHLPYARQEKQFERIGVGVSRQDMANWQENVGIILLSLYVMLKGTLNEGKVLRMDETTVQVMGEEDRKDTQKSYMWLARGGPPGKPVALFKYSSSRRAENVDEFIEGFHGYLQTDGYAGYDSAVKGRSDIIHVGCFAHARRKFFEAQKTGVHAKPAAIGISSIKGLYSVIETAKLNGHNPSQYLKTLFERIPYAVSPDDWSALLPWNISPYLN